MVRKCTSIVKGGINELQRIDLSSIQPWECVALLSKTRLFLFLFILFLPESLEAAPA